MLCRDHKDVCHAQRQSRPRHRLDQRHRPGHRPGLCQAKAPISCINGFGDTDGHRKGAQRHRKGFRRQGALFRRRHEQGRPRSPPWSPTPTSKLGSVDILVNNAGIQFVSPIEEFPPEKWDQIIAINLSAAFHAIRAAVPGMKAKKWGRIINTASAHALVASPFKSAYVSAKHGIAGLTKTVALETATFGITANAICPGYVWTPLVEKQIPDTMAARGLTARTGDQRRAAGTPSPPSSSSRWRRSRPWRSISPATSPARSPARSFPSMAAGPRNKDRR